MTMATLSSSRSSNHTPLPEVTCLDLGTSHTSRDLDQENKMGAAIFPSYSGQLLS